MPQHTERAAGAQARAGGLQLKRPSVSNFLVIRGLRYHVRSWGREGAPKLFMLHGWMDCSASFQFFAEAFDGDWHLIAPDWRGYGLSEWPARDTYWHPELIGDLDHLLQHYSPEEPVNLMAHSMGGGLASIYAGARPERIARYVNLEAYGMLDSTPHDAPKYYARWLQRLHHRPRSPGYGSYEKLAARFRIANKNLTVPRSLFIAHHMGKTNHDGRIVLRCDPRHKDFFNTPAMYGLDEVKACWREITAPVLWIEADDGAPDSRRNRFGLDGIAARKQHIRNRRDVFFPDTSHQVHIERPEQLAAVVKEFLATSQPAPSAGQGAAARINSKGSTRMKTYFLDQPGSIDNLALREAPAPVPGRGQVLIRVRATSLNYRDLGLVTGAYRSPHMPLPLVPMSDGAGEIVAVGEAVTRVKVGDRVAGIFHQGWIGGPRRAEHPVGDLGGGVHGMLSELVVLSEDGVVHVPPHLSLEEAATLPCAGVTAWNALQVRQPLLAGETVLVQGTGGVSIFALQFAKLTGARVIATSSSDARLERLRAMGADEVINYTTHPDWENEVRKLTGNRGVDVIVEVVGSMTQSLKCLRVGGRIGLVGQRGGRGAESPLGMLVGRHVTLYGIGVGSRDDFEAMNRAIDLHRLKPLVDKVFPFEQAREAYRYLESRAHFGKVVIAGPK